MERIKNLVLEIQARVDAFSTRGVNEANMLVETHNLIVALRKEIDIMTEEKAD